MSNQELAVERSYAQLLFMVFSCVINHLPHPLFSSSCIFTICMMLSWCNPFVHLNLLNHKYLFLRCSFRSRSIVRVIHLVLSVAQADGPSQSEEKVILGLNGFRDWNWFWMDLEIEIDLGFVFEFEFNHIKKKLQETKIQN